MTSRRFRIIFLLFSVLASILTHAQPYEDVSDIYRHTDGIKISTLSPGRRSRETEIIADEIKENPVGGLGTEIRRCDEPPCVDRGECRTVSAGYTLCICKDGLSGSFCQIGSNDQSHLVREDKKIERKENALLFGELVLISAVIVATFISFFLCVHYCHVGARRHKILQSYNAKLARGETLTSLPPEWCDVSNEVCREFFCCCPCCKRVEDYSEMEKTDDSGSDLNVMLKEILEKNSSNNIVQTGAGNGKKSKRRHSKTRVLKRADKCHTSSTDEESDVEPTSREYSVSRGHLPGNYSSNCSSRPLSYSQMHTKKKIEGMKNKPCTPPSCDREQQRSLFSSHGKHQYTIPRKQEPPIAHASRRNDCIAPALHQQTSSNRGALSKTSTRFPAPSEVSYCAPATQGGGHTPVIRGQLTGNIVRSNYSKPGRDITSDNESVEVCAKSTVVYNRSPQPQNDFGSSRPGLFRLSYHDIVSSHEKGVMHSSEPFIRAENSNAVSDIRRFSTPSKITPPGSSSSQISSPLLPTRCYDDARISRRSSEFGFVGEVVSSVLSAE